MQLTNTPPPLLRCDRLDKAFAGVRVLRGVSLEVLPGELHGIVGENGAGKSTLMNLIGGVHQLSAGWMEFGGAPYTPATPLDAAHTGIAFVHQELNLFPNLSIAENIFVGQHPVRRIAGVPFADRAAAATRTRALLDEVGLTTAAPDTLVERLPQGDRQLVEIAKGLNQDARLIIFDEPTTSLTNREVERLFTIVRRLQQRGIAILYISHALEHVLTLAGRITVLRDGAVVETGPRTGFDTESLIRAMVGRDIEHLYPPLPSPPSSPAKVLEVRNLSQPGVIENITFDLHKGEIVGIAGLMGSGRSELARILFGLDPAGKGSVRLNGAPLDGLPPRARIARGLAFVTESRRDDGLFPDASVAENLRIVHPASPDPLRMLKELHVAAASSEQAVGELSGGNQQKVVLGKWLLNPPAVLILDEPTRGIDVGARQEIYSVIASLAERGMSLLVISSEIEELIGLCTRIMVMAGGELRAEFPAGTSREDILRAAV
ncbi:MAG: sugar ABC transporter ATP-binding protein [Bryobacteraceae bacterium]|nr:sugar ABC transporter ATP-binding protein [Bryobacteraceae bacterium]